MYNTHVELTAMGGYFILNYASDYQSCNPRIQITKDQWERLDTIRIQLDIFMLVFSSDQLNDKLEISFGVVTTILARCVELEMYDILAEAMQLFHEMGVDTQKDELL